MKHLFLLLSILVLPYSLHAYFNDIAMDSPYKQAIFSLRESEIINGNGKGGFRPTDKITRAEAAVIVTKAFPDSFKKEKSCIKFDDLEQNAWFAPAINKVVCNQIWKGYAGKIKPAKTMNYAEAVELIYRSKYKKTIASNKQKNGYIEFLKNNQLLPYGYKDRFSSVSRAEFAQLVYNFQRFQAGSAPQKRKVWQYIQDRLGLSSASSKLQKLKKSCITDGGQWNDLVDECVGMREVTCSHLDGYFMECIDVLDGGVYDISLLQTDEINPDDGRFLNALKKHDHACITSCFFDLTAEEDWRKDEYYQINSQE